MFRAAAEFEVGASRMSVYKLLAVSVDVTHALSMLLWGLGLPLLIGIVFHVSAGQSHRSTHGEPRRRLERQLLQEGGGHSCTIKTLSIVEFVFCLES